MKLQIPHPSNLSHIIAHASNSDGARLSIEGETWVRLQIQATLEGNTPTAYPHNDDPGARYMKFARVLCAVQRTLAIAQAKPVPASTEPVDMSQAPRVVFEPAQAVEPPINVKGLERAFRLSADTLGRVIEGLNRHGIAATQETGVTIPMGELARLHDVEREHAEIHRELSEAGYEHIMGPLWNLRQVLAKHGHLVPLANAMSDRIEKQEVHLVELEADCVATSNALTAVRASCEAYGMNSRGTDMAAWIRERLNIAGNSLNTARAEAKSGADHLEMIFNTAKECGWPEGDVSISKWIKDMAFARAGAEKLAADKSSMVQMLMGVASAGGWNGAVSFDQWTKAALAERNELHSYAVENGWRDQATLKQWMEAVVADALMWQKQRDEAMVVRDTNSRILGEIERAAVARGWDKASSLIGWLQSNLSTLAECHDIAMTYGCNLHLSTLGRWFQTCASERSQYRLNEDAAVEIIRGVKGYPKAQSLLDVLRGLPAYVTPQNGGHE